MRILVCLLLMTCVCSAQVVTYRYTDKATGDERGQCSSDIYGNAPVNNPDWNMEIIDEKDRDFYMKEHQKQVKAKNKAIKNTLKAKKKIIKDKLKTGTPLSQEDVDILLGSE